MDKIRIFCVGRGFQAAGFGKIMQVQRQWFCNGRNGYWYNLAYVRPDQLVTVKIVNPYRMHIHMSVA